MLDLGVFLVLGRRKIEGWSVDERQDCRMQDLMVVAGFKLNLEW